MKCPYSKNDYVKAFSTLVISDHHKRMLIANFNAAGNTITASEMARVVNYKNYNAANLHYGRLGRKIGECLGWSPLPEEFVGVLVTFAKPDKEWHWILRPEVKEALECIGWVKEQPFIIPEEIKDTRTFPEGAVHHTTVNAYERSLEARSACIKKYGYCCSVCEINLEEVYGAVASEFIHVHHLKPLADIGRNYKIDPIKELCPVCPTCHAIMHLSSPPYTIKEMKCMMAEAKRK